ncbi:MAG: DNA polymerase I, partial [Alphaproteobacteria bacterium]|nr:DNA polymerase I [Alphaproteobacteria bacterium]
KFGVGPDKVVDVQSLSGDSVDNVPGVPGIGPKIAAELINEYGDLDTLLARAAEIKQPKRRENLIEFADNARVSRELVRLREDAPVEQSLDELVWQAPDPDTLLAFLEAQSFRSIADRLRKRWAEAGVELAEPEPAGPDASEAEYVLVRDLKTLEVWLDEARALGVVAYDSETNSLDAMQARLVGFSLATGPGKACYVPLAHVAPVAQPDLLDGDGARDGKKAAAKTGKQIPMAKALVALKELMEDSSVLKLGHNIKYDLTVLAQACARELGNGTQLAPRSLDDTMLLSYVLDAGRHRHGLDDLAARHLDHEMIKFKDLVGIGKKQITFDQVGLDEARDYAAEDADMTWRLHAALKPRLAGEHMTTVYETIERPLIGVLTDMERAGITVDAAELNELSHDFAGRMVDLEAQAYGLAGEEFNLGSPKQLGEILFDKMSLPGGKKGKTGAYGTGADILEDLAAQGHDLPRTVLDWRQLSKLKSTYADALTGQINPETGRVHTAYGMAIAQTGRLSSTDPNLQNIPVRTEEGRKIRHAFRAAPGCKLVSLDYSQIELRIVADVAGIEPLIEAFHDGQDIHALTASQVFDVPLKDITGDTAGDLRRRAKAINFGIIYGISAFGLARNLGIDRGEAKRYIDAYFERYPGIREYMDQTVAFARSHLYVETLFGRRIHLAGITEKNANMRNFAERQAINAPIQGTAADIIKRAMIRVPGALDEAKLGATMLLQVHDELLFDVPEAEVDATIACVRAVMEGATRPVLELAVPLVADAGVGDSWDQAH